MDEQQLKTFTDALLDIEKLHNEIRILKTKYVAMFAAVKSSLSAANIPFELDETYLNELLDKFVEDVPFATQAELEGANVKDEGPAVMENTGEVATFSNGKQFLRQRPQLWPQDFVRPGLHAGLAASATALPYDSFKKAFAVGNSYARVRQILADPSVLETSDGIPSSKGHAR
jgi:hypothetical protein